MQDYRWVREGHELCAMDGDTVAGRILFPEVTRGTWTVTSTFVHPDYRGHGLASELVRRVADGAAANGKSLNATCSYAVAWLKRHGDDGDD